jgi:hypothetical protein
MRPKGAINKLSTGKKLLKSPYLGALTPINVGFININGLFSTKHADFPCQALFSGRTLLYIWPQLSESLHV